MNSVLSRSNYTTFQDNKYPMSLSGHLSLYLYYFFIQGFHKRNKIQNYLRFIFSSLNVSMQQEKKETVTLTFI